MKHLTDLELQLYLDGSLLPDNKKIVSHLAGCDICKLELERYKTVYAELKNEDEAILSASFADKVIAALPEKKQSFAFLNSESFMYATAAVMMIITVLYYGESFAHLKNVFVSLGEKILGYNYLNFTSLSQYPELSNSLVEYAIASVVLILFYAKAEKIINFFKNKTATISI